MRSRCSRSHCLLSQEACLCQQFGIKLRTLGLSFAVRGLPPSARRERTLGQAHQQLPIDLTKVRGLTNRHFDAGTKLLPWLYLSCAPQVQSTKLGDCSLMHLGRRLNGDRHHQGPTVTSPTGAYGHDSFSVSVADGGLPRCRLRNNVRCLLAFENQTNGRASASQ